MYNGAFGREYAFFSVSRDNVGHEEVPPATADATTFIVNTTPAAQDDSYSADENVPLVVIAAEGVLTNDTDEDGEPIHAELLRNALYGTVELHADGSFTYTPDTAPNRKHWDSFEYQASDGVNVSTTATVSITIETDYPWSNSEKPLDVNEDDYISPIDALQIINELNRHGGYRLPVERPRPLAKPFYDVNHDGYIAPIDALLVINHLNRSGRRRG